MTLLPSLPENAGLADLRARHSELFDLLRPYAQRLMRGPSPLTCAQRELIAAYVSAVNSCRFCAGTHEAVARGFGIDETMLETLMTSPETAPVEQRLKPILRYVQKLTLSPSRMTEGDARAVYEAGWSEEALVHAVAVCAYFNNMNRLVEGTGIVGDAAGRAGAAERLIANGYLGTARSG